jgi:aerobic C4-dicarboxylate transport protein
VETAAFGCLAGAKPGGPETEPIFSNDTKDPMPTSTPQPDAPAPRPKRFYTSLWVQVSVAIVAAVLFGYLSPARAVAMKPLGDAFIRMITMIITVMIFCTVVTGIAGMQDLRKVGRVGGKALLYFEIISTLALAVGFLVGNVVHPGTGFNVDPTTLDTRAVAEYAGQAKAQTVTDFLMHIIPTTIVDAFAKGDILEVVFVSILFGFAMSAAAAHAKPLVTMLESLTKVVFRMVNIVMRLAPIGAFGAMAFTIGKYGLASLGPLLRLIASFWITSILFVVVVFGAIAWVAGFSLVKFLLHIKEEILLVLATSSSETAIPTLMEKLEGLGCSRSLVGLVVPTGYTFNTDGSALYMTIAALFVAQATNTHLTFLQQMTIFSVAMLTSKGASGVQGASFIALVATLSVIPTIPVAGMALILGIDRFMSMFRALVNMIGNGVATLVVARWENELGRETLQRNLA